MDRVGGVVLVVGWRWAHGWMALLKNNNDERTEVETLWKRVPPERGAGATASSSRRPFAGLPGPECVHVNRSLGANYEPGNDRAPVEWQPLAQHSPRWPRLQSASPATLGPLASSHRQSHSCNLRQALVASQRPAGPAGAGLYCMMAFRELPAVLAVTRGGLLSAYGTSNKQGDEAGDRLPQGGWRRVTSLLLSLIEQAPRGRGKRRWAVMALGETKPGRHA
jgi:hypothetical protein